MSSYEPAELSFNLANGESWSRIGYGLLSNILYGVMVTAVLYLIVVVFIKVSFALTIVLSVIAVPLCLAFSMSFYEKMRGCNFRHSD